MGWRMMCVILLSSTCNLHVDDRNTTPIVRHPTKHTNVASSLLVQRQCVYATRVERLLNIRIFSEPNQYEMVVDTASLKLKRMVAKCCKNTTVIANVTFCQSKSDCKQPKY